MIQKRLAAVFFMFVVLFLLFWGNGCKVNIDQRTNESLSTTAVQIKPLHSDPTRPARAHVRRYKGPLIDAHAHLDPPEKGVIIREKLMAVLSEIESSGVDYVILMPTPNEGKMKGRSNGAKYRKAAARLGKPKIGLFCGSEYISNAIHRIYHRRSDWDMNHEMFKHLLTDLEDEGCIGVGEVACYHFNKTGNQNIIAYPPDFEPFLKVVEMIAQSSKWLDLHAEPYDHTGKSYEESVFKGLALLHKKFPSLKLIIAHTGMTTPTNAKKILMTYPNVMMHFKPIKKHHLWRNLEPVTNERGHLYEDWATLFEAMPNRFLVGTDEKFGRKGKGVLAPHGKKLAKYPKSIRTIRKILGTISESAARKIAFENAVRIYDIQGLD